MCNSQKCAICECDDQSIPAFWKEQKKHDEAEMVELSYHHQIDFNSKLPMPQVEKTRGDWCESDSLNSKEGDFIFVSMKDNKESFTAYNGSQIWNSIYQENCLLEKLTELNLNPHQTCSEETLLYQAVSGLHSSVNTHISHQYVDVA